MGTSNNKEQVSAETKLTAEEQESGVEGKTTSLNGDSPIELDRIYVLSNKTGETITGLELQRLANQGKLSRELQSKLDKTTVEHKSATDRITELEREREQLIVKATIADSYIAGKTAQQTEVESEVDFNLWDEGTDEGKKTTMTKPVEVRNRNEISSQIPNEIINEVKTIRGELQEIKAERKQTANDAELERIANYDNEQTFITYKSELPDVDDTTLRQIIRSDNIAESMRINAMNKRLSNDETWADDLVSSRQLQAKARKMYVEATKQQEVASIRKDNETSVEGGSPVDGPIQLPEGFKFDTNPEKAERQWKELNEKNKQASKLKRRAVR